MEIDQERKGQEKKFDTLCRPIVESLGLKLYDLEYNPGQKVLRLFIMNVATKSATIEECVSVDNALTDTFEKETWINDGITLEVSSPGIFRKLNQRCHFLSSVGEQIEIVLNSNARVLADGELKKIIKGEKKLVVILEGINIDSNEIQVNYKSKSFVLLFDEIKKAHLAPDI